MAYYETGPFNDLYKNYIRTTNARKGKNGKWTIYRSVFDPIKDM